MIKKEYSKPEMQVVKFQHHAQILTGSVTSIMATGLDTNEELVLPDLPTTGNPWADAW